MKSCKLPFDAFQEIYTAWIKRVASKIRLSRWPFLCACIAEFLGTMILVIFGLGCSAQKTLGNYLDKGDFLSMSINWGIGLSMGLFVSGVMGAGLINPALTLAFAVVGKVPLIRILPYTLCQLFGAWVGALLLLGVYNQQISDFALKHDQGLRLMHDTGAIFVTRPRTIHGYCIMDQIFGTAILAGMALAIGDRYNFNVPGTLQPLYIGLLLTGLQNALCANCGGALNPARDLGPRIALLMCGWGTDSFRDSNYYFWIPIVGPYVGALVGAIAYELLVGVHLVGLDAVWKKQAAQNPKNSDSSSDDEDSDSSSESDDDGHAIILPLSRRSRIISVSALRRHLNKRLNSEASSEVSDETSTGTIILN